MTEKAPTVETGANIQIGQQRYDIDRTLGYSLVSFRYSKRIDDENPESHPISSMVALGFVSKEEYMSMCEKVYDLLSTHLQGVK